MNDELFDRWLYESESDSLDFKREQYKFVGASDNEKSELLKDILAIANSWRRVDGYIVIGIEDRPVKPNILHGITNHIDDASIQQFIKSKVSGICKFEYKTFTNTKDGRTYGIIRIPVQKRPIFIVKDYGRLKANTVYVRRGSSTDEAKPDEISKMGMDQYELITKPIVDIGFFDRSKGKMTGAEINFETTYFVILDKIPDYSENVYGFMPSVTTNKAYYRNLVKYINFTSSFSPVYLAITNKGDKEAVNLRIEFEIFSSNAEILLDGEEIDVPKVDIMSNFRSVQQSLYRSSYSVDRQDDKWVIYNRFDRLHAKRTLYFNGTIYIQVKESDNITGKATVFFDGQSVPHEQELKIKVQCNRIELKWNDFYEKFLKEKDN
jgi:hypothetical protein